ncbi:MAG TPA: UDP-N-acetylmuramoyl-L-alanyl-D-glutamate--2,6-diaminopimelate ligase [Polyangiales bacterium]
MTPVTLGQLQGLPFVQAIAGAQGLPLLGVNSDSRAVQSGDLFAAVQGARSDGRKFVPQALQQGAAAVLCDAPLAQDVPHVRVDDVRARLGPIAHFVYGEPTKALKTVAVTGTNGKTTVGYLLETLLAEAGQRPALLGTVAARGPAYAREAELTTPEADAVARFAADQLRAGATHLVMEASSIAIDQRRTLGLSVEVGVFTNLTQDHLDYHGTMQAYGAAKARLFEEYAPRHSVIMVDQPFGRLLGERAKGRVLRASMSPNAQAELRVLRYVSSRAGIEASVETPWGLLSVQSPLFGAHNLENLLVSIGSALALGLERAQIERALGVARGAPGRLERVATPLDLMVLVDYAHTPDAIERALGALRPLTRGRLFVVCGCGGDRDPSKRAPMGEAAVRGADVSVLTSDNPRSEIPAQILAQMVVGAERAGQARSLEQIKSHQNGYVVIEDRAEAIRCAIATAEPGDTLLIAGKGHETYQIVGRERRSFDDRLEAAAALAAWGAG